MEISVDSAPCFVFAFADDGKITQVNHTACEGLGYQKGELIECNIELVLTLASRIFFQTHLFPMVKLQHKAEEIFIELQSKSGQTIPVLVNAQREMREVPLNIMVAIVVHNRQKYEMELIAAKKKVEAALQTNQDLMRTREELQRNTEVLDRSLFKLRMQNNELKQLNRALTHDMEEPVRKLTFFTGLLLDEFSNEDLPVSRQIRRLSSITGQMRSILEGLQQYVWLTENSINYTAIDFNKLLLVVQQSLKNEYPEKNWSVKYNELPVIYGDWEQLRLLFYYILSNSIKFKRNDRDCIIQVTATQLMQNSFLETDNKYHYSHYLKIDISDNGIGFDPAFKNQIFDLFKKLHTGKGRGLGLALSKKIVDNHLGKIEAIGSLEDGTRVTIFLPLGAGIKSAE